MGGVSAAVSKTAAAPIERVKLLIQNQVGFVYPPPPIMRKALPQFYFILISAALNESRYLRLLSTLLITSKVSMSDR